MGKFNEKGEEIMDPTPAAIPAGFRRPPSLHEQMTRYIRTELSQAAANQGYETFEEADDFDVGDDFDPSSPHELEFDPELGREVPRAVKAEVDAARAHFDREHAKAKKAKWFKKGSKKSDFEEESPKKRKKEVVDEGDDQ